MDPYKLHKLYFPSSHVVSESPPVLSTLNEVILPNNVLANADTPMYLPIGRTLSSFTVSSLNANSVLATDISASYIYGTNASFAINFTSSINCNEFHCFNSSIIESLETSTINTKNINTSSIFGISGEVSTFRTNQIVWAEDQIVMEAQAIPGGYALYLNGDAVVTTSTLTSSITEWASFPATSTIQMQQNKIIDLRELNLADIGTPGIFGNISSVGNIFGSGTGIQTGFITNRATNVLASSMVTSSLSAVNLSSASVTTGSVNATSIVTGSVNSNTLSTGSILVGSISTPVITTQLIQSFSNSSITLAAGSQLNQFAPDINLVADEGALISAFSDVNITGQNGNRGRVNITGNSGFNNGVGGEVNIVANAGSVLGVGSGGLISLTANSPLVVSSFTSAIKLSAAGINSYAGAIPSIGSLAGYNFIYGTLGVNLCTGLPPVLPNIPGTTYLYGSAGVTTSSEFYCPEIYPYWNGLTTPPDLMIAGRYILVNLATVYVRLSTIRSMEMAGPVAAISGVRSLSGTNIAMSGISSINGAAYPPPISFISSFSTLTAANLTVSSINNATYPPPAGATSTFSTLTASTLFAPNAFLSSLNVSSINGAAPGGGASSTFSTLTTSTLFATNAFMSSVYLSSINDMAQFGTKSMTINGDVAQIQLANTAGGLTKLNLLARQNFSEIQSFDSTFTNPRDLYLIADNFGFNTRSIVGGYEVDISGNTIIENGELRIATGLSTGTNITDTFVSTTILNASSIISDSLQVSSITNLRFINGQDFNTFGECLTTNTITVIAPNTPTIIPFDTMNFQNQISLSGGAVEVAQSGLYSFLFSIQLDKSGGGLDSCDFWLRVNGSDVANTASQLTIQGTQGEALAACSFFLNLNATDRIEMVFASADGTMAATYYPPWTIGGGDPYNRPAIPAVVAQIRLVK